MTISLDLITLYLKQIPMDYSQICSEKAFDNLGDSEVNSIFFKFTAEGEFLNEI